MQLTENSYHPGDAAAPPVGKHCHAVRSRADRHIGIGFGRRSMDAYATDMRRSGWVTFAAVVMFAVCFVRIISGINYVGGGSQINDLTGSVFGNQLWVWGIWDLCLAGLVLFAGLSLLGGGGFGRVVVYVW